MSCPHCPHCGKEGAALDGAILAMWRKRQAKVPSETMAISRSSLHRYVMPRLRLAGVKASVRAVEAGIHRLVASGHLVESHKEGRYEVVL